MAQTSAFNEVIEILREVSSVIAGAFQSLSHQQDFKPRGVALVHSLGKMFLEQVMTDSIDVLVHLKDFAGTVKVEIRKAAVCQVEHLAQDRGHLHELTCVGSGNFNGSSLNSESYAHDQIADPLQIGCGFQAREELPGAGLTDASNGSRQPLINIAFNLVEFLFAILDGKKGHPGGSGQQIADVKGGIA